MCERMDAGTIYAEYGDKVRAYIGSRVRNAQDAEDIFANVFLKVTEHFESYDPRKAAYGTWVYTITQNTVRDYFRAAPKQQNMTPIEDLVLAGDGPDTDAGLLREELLDTLAGALEQLPERERDILILRFYKELSPKEIAQRLDISYANVRYLQSIALKKLRPLLAGKL